MTPGSIIPKALRQRPWPHPLLRPQEGDLGRGAPPGLSFNLTEPYIYIWAGVLCIYLGVLRFVFFLYLPMDWVMQVAYGFSALACIFLVTGTLMMLLRRHFLERMTLMHRLRLAVWCLLLFTMLIVGLVEHNSMRLMVTELACFGIMTMGLVLGQDERLWYSLDKTLTVLFYIALFLCLYYSNVVSVKAEYEAYSSLQLDEARHVNTVGYAIRVLLYSAEFLAIWGAVNTRPLGWRIAQLMTIVFQVAVGVLVFRFRSSMIVGLFIIVLIGFVAPIITRRRTFGVISLLLFVVGALGALIVFPDAIAGFVTRLVYETSSDGLFSSRNVELMAFWDSSNLRAIFGRGFGGCFDASSVYTNMPMSDQWMTLHYGFLIFMLVGGVAMLLSMLSFFATGLYPRRKEWYGNPLNAAAALLVWVALLKFSATPIMVISLDASITYFLFFMALSRFGVRTPRLNHLPILPPRPRGDKPHLTR